MRWWHADMTLLSCWSIDKSELYHTRAMVERCTWIHTAWVGELKNAAILLEEVDLLDSGDVVNLQALQGGLQLLLVTCLLVDSLSLSAHGTLTTNTYASLDLLQSLQSLILGCHCWCFVCGLWWVSRVGERAQRG
jgi:hypothetical protein